MPRPGRCRKSRRARRPRPGPWKGSQRSWPQSPPRTRRRRTDRWPRRRSGSSGLAAENLVKRPEGNRTATEWYILATEAFHKGDYRKAIPDLERALQSNPSPQDLWRLLNLLALSHHHLQPADWKPGDSRDWYEGAVKNYEKAIAAASSPQEALLSRANLAFVYMDADEFQPALAAAGGVIEAAGRSPGAESLADLARIVAAASAVWDAPEKGADFLNNVRLLDRFEYLFAGQDVPTEAVDALLKAPNLKPEVRERLTRWRR